MDHSEQPAWQETLAASSLDDAARERFRTLANEAAKAVAVVSARVGSHDVAVTVTDFITVSWDPPTLLVSLYSQGRAADALKSADRWALSILAADQEPVARWLGEPGTPLFGLLSTVPHWRREGGGPALISGALAWFEVRTDTAAAVATHTLFAGPVAWMGAPPLTSPPRAGLVRQRSSYRVVE